MMKYYRNTLVLVAEDCPIEHAQIPTSKKDGKTKHQIEYELLTKEPYVYDHEGLIYAVYVKHCELEEQPGFDAEAVRKELFSRPHPCMRASMLPKKFGWGVHYDSEGRMALVAMESPEYAAMVEDDAIALVPAMRSSRANKGG